jgi:hypothetical protein
MAILEQEFTFAPVIKNHSVSASYNGEIYYQMDCLNPSIYLLMLQSSIVTYHPLRDPDFKGIYFIDHKRGVICACEKEADVPHPDFRFFHNWLLNKHAEENLKKEINKFDPKQRHSTLDNETLFLYYKEYQSMGGTDNLEKYTEIISSFLEITLGPVVFGDLEKTDGGQWESSQHSVVFWQEKHQLTENEKNLYFISADQVHPYT